MREANDGACCGHFGTHATLTKILRMGYIWLTLHDDVREVIGKCPACKHHANLINIPSCNLISIESLWPFHYGFRSYWKDSSSHLMVISSL